MTGLVMFATRPEFRVTLAGVVLVTRGRPGRLGGGSRLGRGDIPGVCQRAGAEEGDEGAEHELSCAWRFLLACVPAAYPASDGGHSSEDTA